MTLEVFLSLLGILIGLSGWAAFAYERITAGPRLRGRILTVIAGQADLPNERVTTFLVYLYITNLRNHSVHVLDYEMEIDFGEGFKRLRRWYGADSIRSFKFTDPSGKEIVIPDFQEKLIYKNSASIGFGQLYSGFILFAGDVDLYTKKAKRYRVICIDALGKRHQFTSRELGNLNLLQEMTGMIIPS